MPPPGGIGYAAIAVRRGPWSWTGRPRRRSRLLNPIPTFSSGVRWARRSTLAHLGVTNTDIPITAPKVWAVLKEKSVAL